ncbi:MAG: hypothetical protein AB1489_20120 [Acidobacteriota bacterium]
MKLVLAISFACMVLVTNLTEQVHSRPSVGNERLVLPARLAIYYGYPSLINGAQGDINAAVRVLADYDVVVLGDGLEFTNVKATRRPPGSGHTENLNVRRIIRLLRRSTRRTAVYGYIDLGNTQKLSLAELQQRTRLWADMGVRGIFLDEAGYDFGVTRTRQNEIIEYIHSLGLNAFVNAYNPDDVFSSATIALNAVGGGNPDGLPCSLGKKDIFLLESFQIQNGGYEEAIQWASRVARAVKYRERFGTRLFAVTTADSQPFSSAQLEYAWWSALLWGLEGFGWGEPNFSSVSSELPWRPRPIEKAELLGSYFTSSVTQNNTQYLRATDRGQIVIDTNNFTGRFLAHSP